MRQPLRVRFARRVMGVYFVLFGVGLLVDNHRQRYEASLEAYSAAVAEWTEHLTDTGVPFRVAVALAVLNLLGALAFVISIPVLALWAATTRTRPQRAWRALQHSRRAVGRWRVQQQWRRDRRRDLKEPVARRIT